MKLSKTKTDDYKYEIITDEGDIFYSDKEITNKNKENISKIKYSDRFKTNSHRMYNLYRKIIMLKKHKDANLDEKIDKWKDIIKKGLDELEELGVKKGVAYTYLNLNRIMSLEELDMTEDDLAVVKESYY